MPSDRTEFVSVRITPSAKRALTLLAASRSQNLSDLCTDLFAAEIVNSLPDLEASIDDLEAEMRALFGDAEPTVQATAQPAVTSATVHPGAAVSFDVAAADGTDDDIAADLRGLFA